MTVVDVHKRKWLSILLDRLDAARKDVNFSLPNAVRARRVRRTLKELKRLEDHELFDIGLSREELTPEGLAKASARRAANQNRLSQEKPIFTVISGRQFHGRYN